MKRRIWGFLAVCMLASGTAAAQPVLGSSSLPTVGRSYTRYYYDTTGVDAGTSGTGVFWNYSTLTWTRASTETRIVARNVLPIDVQARYPEAQFGVINDTTTTLMQLRNGFLREVGISTPKADIASSTGNPYDTRPVELKYSTQHNDTWQAQITTKPASFSLGRAGTVSTVYDGYGQLFLPDGSIRDGIARTTTTTRTTDTLRLQGPSPGTVLVTTLTIRHTWQPPAHDVPLLEMSTTIVSTTRNGQPVGPQQRWRSVWSSIRPDGGTSVEGDAETSRAYPNPVRRGGVVHIADLSMMPQYVRYVDVHGRQLDAVWSLVGDTELSVQVPELGTGPYMIVIADDRRVNVIPVVVTP
ncbi:MAG: hypothetical protein J0I17_03105 ['Candidatus Kapabacteria' thiocyanatum]|uniref:Secretion system C-terminal sorting domain-containing protein n=1 Tax=Candidatus Kapaibacterium thiocyanatum TaxID=1895771 RepID=A0A1M3KXP0_9BACT|nr:hypothetical protein ['Candidatus Kapabacteria' thiocyanatum]OJX57145.1 MAG: hypothetical protein BGO89_11630 ['Candidatus Kapabacteria' thiocyanatum]